MSDSLVKLEDVRLAFGSQEVLKGVNLEVERKERLVVMGQSGGGKSTLLRLILGLLKPTGGRVICRGQEVNKLSRREASTMRRKIGMVYQYSALISSMTVRENLALPLEELTDKARDEIESIIKEKLKLVDMSQAIDKMPAELSGGMRKRVSLARALVTDPELVLFDEPSAGLDPVISSVIDELIIDLAERSNATCVVVTHEMDSAFRVATRMAMLFRGTIIEQGTPEEFRNTSNPVLHQFLNGETEGPITEELN